MPVERFVKLQSHNGDYVVVVTERGLGNRFPECLTDGDRVGRDVSAAHLGDCLLVSVECRTCKRSKGARGCWGTGMNELIKFNIADYTEIFLEGYFFIWIHSPSDAM